MKLTENKIGYGGWTVSTDGEEIGGIYMTGPGAWHAFYDKSTGDFSSYEDAEAWVRELDKARSRSAGAKRQAALKERRESLGFKRSTVWIHQPSYDQGVNAAQLGSGTIRDFPADVVDVQSWVLGYATEITKFEQMTREAIK